MKILKTKQGFTLIELLVVIGILAVLAAIAIPSVAGLIDRANVSADSTNANEMTNTLERFASEYELYLQDIASGRLDTTNLDSAQGRVFNVTGVTDRAGIEALEKDATAGVDTTGKAIYRDTKYPVNAETMQAVVENYMKTSSTTFTPKQSDCHYYYSPDCGLVVCTETEKSDVTNLNALVQSGKDAKGKNLDTSTKWIDLTANISLSDGSSTPSVSLNHSGIIPEGATYTKADGTVLSSGDAFPETLQALDVYRHNNYTYVYNAYWYYSPYDTTNFSEQFEESNLDGWLVTVFDNPNETSYGTILESIGGKQIKNMNHTFLNRKSLITAPAIPQTVTEMRETFAHCTSLTGEIIINANPSDYASCFFSYPEIDFQTQNITLTGSSTMLDEIGATGYNYCNECNGYCTCGNY